ncbi:MAG: hypothetical protein R3270_07835 [Gammaproteobacteria bacterium]|nr:hypothetical protein [Gammaproteobacteria bacterium]
MRHSTLPAVLVLLLAPATGSALVGDAIILEPEQLETLEQVSRDMEKTSASDALEHLIAKPAGEPLTEYRLRKALLAQALPLDPVTRNQVESLTRRDARVMVWMEHPGTTRRPGVAIDVAATAKHLLRQDDSFRKAQQISAAAFAGKSLHVDDENAWRTFARMVDADLAAATLRAHLGQSPVEKALADLAIATGSSELAMDLVSKGNGERLVNLAGDVLNAFPNSQERLVKAGLQQPELAAVMLGELRDHANTPWARELLKRELESPQLGIAAAVSIGRGGDDALLADMYSLLASNSPGAPNAALALHMSHSPYAITLLQRYLDEQPDGQLAGQVKEWLK